MFENVLMQLTMDSRSKTFMFATFAATKLRAAFDASGGHEALEQTWYVKTIEDLYKTMNVWVYIY